MSIFTNLSDLQKATEVKNVGSGDLVNRFFTVKDGEKFLLRFRQELVQDSPGFNEEVGAAQVIGVHANPADFRKSAACTADDEKYNYKCWACEQVGKDNGWRKKQHLVINVAIFDPDEKVWNPRVLDQKFASAHVGQQVVDMAVEYGTLLTHDYKISRKGSGQKTQYNLLPVGVKDEDPAISELPFHDLSNMYRSYSYAEQAGFYLAEEDTGSTSGWS